MPRSEQYPQLLNECATSALSMRHRAEMLLILKKSIFGLIIQRFIPICPSKKISQDFVRGQSVAETCFIHWG